VRHISERGVPIFTYLRVKVFALQNKHCTLRVFKPKAGKGWDAAGVEGMLTEIGADLERRFPAHEFKRIQVGPLAFNFVFVGTRAVPAEGVKDGAPEVGIQNSERSQS
jgi:hypothetical protein